MPWPGHSCHDNFKIKPIIDTISFLKKEEVGDYTGKENEDCVSF
jgi:hypothetical protein